MTDRIIIYGIILSYLIFILAKGMKYAKKVENADDFLLGGRQFSWFLIFCTTGATLIGGGASMGAIGKTYDWGILMLIATVGWYVQLIFSGYFVAPRFRQLSVYTVAGFLGHHFGRRVHILAGILSLLFSVGILAAQMVAFGKAVHSLIPEVSFVLALWIGALAVISYNLAGGLWAVVWTDVYQFFILLFGFALTAIVCLSKMNFHSVNVPDYFFHATSNKGLIFAIGTILAFTVGEMFAPGYATRFSAGKTDKDCSRGVAASGWVLLFLFPPMIFMIALFARTMLPGVDPQSALPETLLYLHNPWISGIILAAVVCAVMSSADSILNSGTAVMVKDLWEPLGKGREMGEKELLGFSRMICLGLGAVSTLIASLVPDIIKLLLWTYSIWAPMIVVPCLMATFPSLRLPKLGNGVLLIMIIPGILTVFYRLWVLNPVFDVTAFGFLSAVGVYACACLLNALSKSNSETSF